MLRLEIFLRIQAVLSSFSLMKQSLSANSSLTLSTGTAARSYEASFSMCPSYCDPVLTICVETHLEGSPSTVDRTTRAEDQEGIVNEFRNSLFVSLFCMSDMKCAL